MTKNKELIAKNIKATLIELAVNDELPLDMNGFDETVLYKCFDEPQESKEPDIETHEYLDHPDGGLVSADFNNRTGKYVDEESKEPLVSDNDYMEWFYEHDNEWQNDTRNNADGEGEELIDYLRRNYKIEPREVKEPLGITPGDKQLFVDAGDYERTGKPDEIFIRIMHDGEAWDICRMTECETGDPLRYSKEMTAAHNSTYGNGYNPEAMEGLVAAMEKIKRIYDNEEDAAGKIAKESLQNVYLTER
jgi:hypothetical protein